MPVAMEVQTVQQFNQVEVATTQTLFVTMLLMPSMTTTRRTQLPLAVSLEEQRNFPTLTQVRCTQNTAFNFSFSGIQSLLRTSFLDIQKNQAMHYRPSLSMHNLP